MSCVSCHTLSEKDLRELLTSCQKSLSAKWENLGALLGISMNTIEAIKIQRLNNSSDCLMDLFTAWLKIDSKNQPPPSWRVLCEALEVIDLELAQLLASTHSCDCQLCSERVSNGSLHIANTEELLLIENEKLQRKIQEMGEEFRAEKEKIEKNFTKMVAERDCSIDFMREELSRTRAYCRNGKLQPQISEEDHQQLSILLLEKAKAGNVNEVSDLALHGADINYTDQNNQTPLHSASKAGHTDVVRVLLSHGAKVDVKNSKGSLTSLHLASKNGHTEIVNVLLSYGATINIKENVEFQTPLHLAAIRGQTEIAQELLIHGASPCLEADRKQTPLHRASENGRVEIVRLLIEYKATVNAKNMFGNTPLHLASRKGATDIVKLLVDTSKADINYLNKESRSPLHEACELGRTEVVKLLMSFEASINVKDQHDQSPLHTTLLQGHIDTAIVLLLAGADITVKDKYGQTPVHIAVALKLEEVLKFIQSNNGVTKKEMEEYTVPPGQEAVLDDEKPKINYRKLRTKSNTYEQDIPKKRHELVKIAESV